MRQLKAITLRQNCLRSLSVTAHRSDDTANRRNNTGRDSILLSLSRMMMPRDTDPVVTCRQV